MRFQNSLVIWRHCVNRFSQHQLKYRQDRCTKSLPPTKDLISKGQKPIGCILSVDRGVTATIFCQKIINPLFMDGAPPGTRVECGPKGFMTKKLFPKCLDHFIDNVKPFEHEPIVLIMDNHSTHRSIGVIQKVKDNHICLLPIPSDCYPKLQPLDVSVFGPFKAGVRNAQYKYMKEKNP